MGRGAFWGEKCHFFFLCVGESGNSIEQEERGEEDLKGCAKMV